MTEPTTARDGERTGAERIRNRCAFTSRDMGADWPEAFTYAVVLGWDADPGDSEDFGAMDEMAARWGWDEALVEFLRDAHRRFQALAPSDTAVAAGEGCRCTATDLHDRDCPAVSPGGQADEGRCSGDQCWYTLPLADGLIVAHSKAGTLDVCEGGGRPPLAARPDEALIRRILNTVDPAQSGYDVRAQCVAVLRAELAPLLADRQKVRQPS